MFLVKEQEVLEEPVFNLVILMLILSLAYTDQQNISIEQEFGRLFFSIWK